MATPGTFFILATVCASAFAIQCPGEWTENENHCYRFENQQRATWVDAEESCKTRGGHLVTIDSADENEFIYNWWVSMLNPLQGRPQFFWTGYSKDAGGNWGWSNGASSSFTRWGTGQPDKLVTTNSATMTTTSADEDGKWDNVNCETSRAFMCESSPPPPRPGLIETIVNKIPNPVDVINSIPRPKPFKIFGKK